MAPRRPVGPRTQRRKVRVRRASAGDMDTLVEHRIGMWRDIGGRTERVLRAHEPVYRSWAGPRLRSGELSAVIAEVDGRPAGSGALWWMPAQPRPGLPAVTNPYILSVYTRPEYRGLGVATAVVHELVRLARRGRAARVTLHASSMGRGVYERLGFEATTEMRKWLRPSARSPRPGERVSPRGRAGSRR
jgi:GNAT superfamily N-acetyltransferase